MSARAWNTIDYSRVASVCMKNNKKKFEVRSSSPRLLTITLRSRSSAALRRGNWTVAIHSPAAVGWQRCLSNIAVPLHCRIVHREVLVKGRTA